MSGVGEVVSNGSLVLAAPLAIAAGAVSFFSPCCLPLVPGYLSYASGMAGDGAVSSKGRMRTVLGGGLFVLGFSAVFVSYGALFGGLGRLLILHQRGVSITLGTLTVILGLLFAGALNRFSIAGREWMPRWRPRVGLAGAPLLGVLFGIGWTPCIGPTLGAVLGLAVDSATAARGAFLSLLYSLGLGIPFILLSLGMGSANKRLAWFRRRSTIIMRAGGLMLIVVGIAQITGEWNTWIAQLRSWVGPVSSPL